eukprot:s292_g11.t1
MKRPAAKQQCDRPLVLPVKKRPACLKRPAGLKRPSGPKGGHRNVRFDDYLTEITPEVLSRKQFLSKLKKYVANTVPGQHVEIAVSNRISSEQADDMHFVYKFYCKSCTSCMSFKRGWRGRATYDGTSKKFHVRATPVSCHGNFDRRMGVSGHGLKSDEKKLALECLAEGGSNLTVQKVLNEMSEKQPQRDLPAEVAVGHFLRNYKKRRYSKGSKKESSRSPWTLSDLRNLSAELPWIDHEDAHARDLVLLSSHVEKDEVALIMCNVALFSISA